MSSIWYKVGTLNHISMTDSTPKWSISLKKKINIDLTYSAKINMFSSSSIKINRIHLVLKYVYYCRVYIIGRSYCFDAASPWDYLGRYFLCQICMFIAKYLNTPSHKVFLNSSPMVDAIPTIYFTITQ